MVENRLQRPSGVYVCPVFSSRTCVHARHVISMVTVHVVVTVGVDCFKIISNEIYLMCDALCDDCLPRSFFYFFFLRSFCYFLFFKFLKKKSFQPQNFLNLFLFFGRFESQCSY